MKVLLQKFYLKVFLIGIQPQTQKLEIHSSYCHVKDLMHAEGSFALNGFII